MENGIIATPNISRGTQVANILTKALCKIHLDLLCNKLGIVGHIHPGLRGTGIGFYCGIIEITHAYIY